MPLSGVPTENYSDFTTEEAMNFSMPLGDCDALDVPAVVDDSNHPSPEDDGGGEAPSASLSNSPSEPAIPKHHPGAQWDPHQKKWCASYILSSGLSVPLGHFDDEREAVLKCIETDGGTYASEAESECGEAPTTAASPSAHLDVAGVSLLTTSTSPATASLGVPLLPSLPAFSLPNMSLSPAPVSSSRQQNRPMMKKVTKIINKPLTVRSEVLTTAQAASVEAAKNDKKRKIYPV
jgi:hypothetical protein